MYDFFGQRAKRILFEQGAREARRHMQFFHDFVTANCFADVPGEWATSVGHALTISPVWGAVPAEEWDYPAYVNGFVEHIKFNSMSGVSIRRVPYKLSIIPNGRIPPQLMYYQLKIRQAQTTLRLAGPETPVESAKVVPFRLKTRGVEVRL